MNAELKSGPEDSGPDAAFADAALSDVAGENIIDVKSLNKSFKVSTRENESFGAALRSLFHRHFSVVNAVSDVSFSVKKGEIRGLIGPNGAGKSTTIKILSGVLYPSSGDVRVMGFVPWKGRETYVRRIGVVFGQKTQLWWDLPAIDTFSLNRRMYGIPAKNYERNLEYFKDLLGIAEVVKRPVRQLSLGERMKCELVCALLHDPELIYLDEPTIGLDVLSKDTIRQFIKKINAEKHTTFILTTHDLEDIQDLCDRVTIINKGTVVFDDHIGVMSRYFSDRKLVDLVFARPVSSLELSEFKVVSQEGLSARLELDLGGRGLQETLSSIMSRFPIQDMNVADIPIEEVIKDLYRA